MAWDDLTFASNSVLTSAKMTQVFDNFEALIQQNSGAPVWTANNSYLANNAGIAGTSTASFDRLHANGLVTANSGFQSTEVASFGAVHLADAAPATMVAGNAYRDTLLMAMGWIESDGSLGIEVNIVSVSNPATGIYVVTWDRDFDSGSSYILSGLAGSGSRALSFDQRSMSAGTAGFAVRAIADAGLRDEHWHIMAVGS